MAGGKNMEQTGYYKRYVILEELDSGFGLQGAPEGFARFEGNRDGIILTLQIKNIREGTAPYTVILIYGKNKEWGVLRAGTLEVIRGIGSFKRNLDYETINSMDMQPENFQYILIVAEHRERIFIPLAGIFNKTYPWDESVRQRLLRKERVREPLADKTNREDTNPAEDRKVLPGRDKPDENSENKVDDISLEQKLKESFETIEPFLNPRRDYAWYRVNDLARLSNLLFACNMKIPLFANPKILVGLFKYRHLLAGFYRSDRSNMNYFVLGIPAKDDTDGKPFENICRWVGVNNPEYGDMSGYWLVYINLQNGEFVS